MENNIILEFKDVAFKWQGGLELKNINLKVKKSDFILITGPSGSGKSTLMRLAVRLAEPSDGIIYYNGISITEIKPEALRRKVALIQQMPVLTSGSVRDNLLFPYSFEINKNSTIPSDEEICENLKKIGLEVTPESKALSLSVGQKQRLCILRALLLKPAVILMDEPTSALDMENRLLVEKISEEANKNGTTILMVCHSDYRPSIQYRKITVKNGFVTEEKI